MPFFITHYDLTGSARTDVVPDRRAFETAEAAIEAARAQYGEGRYAVVEAADAAELARQTFEDLGSHTDHAQPADIGQPGPYTP